MPFNFKCRIGSVVFLSLLLINCASTPIQTVQSIKVGMDKSEVIELMGAPQRTSRINGRDQWIYFYYLNEARSGAEISFLESKVIQVRRAETDKTLMDELNETSNMESYKKKILDQRDAPLKDLE